MKEVNVQGVQVFQSQVKSVRRKPSRKYSQNQMKVKMKVFMPSAFLSVILFHSIVNYHER